MNDTSPGILILGGGVAGMSAALALAGQDLSVHLVERRDRLGGHAASWACMATDTCQNCGACLSLEMADQVRRTAAISLHLNDALKTLDRSGKGMEALLASGETLAVEKIVNASGFTPFDPDAVSSYHTRDLDRVITTAELNTLIREDRLTAMAGPSPKIAFLQCVGSRNREQNRDYCSQACCKISMRHAGKLLHLLPDADISLFYMDLQTIGKEARTMARELAGSIRLIQGVPAEILEHPETNRLTMVTEDPESSSRMSIEFDLVVLSVGLTQNPDTGTLADTLGATPNGWGFFNTEDTDPGQDIYAAGCAQGPKDILSAIQDGRIAAARILEDMNLSSPPEADIVVIGNGPQAAAVARSVSEKGYTASVFGEVAGTHDNVQNLNGADILAVGGTVGRFSIFYKQGGRKQTLTCGAIVAAPAPDTRSGRIKGALPLGEFAAMNSPADDALILLDYLGPESKSAARQALTAAMTASDSGCRVDILMNKMLVHGALGQQLYDQARRSGIRFLRYDQPEDLDIERRDGHFEIRMKEATLPGVDLLLTPGVLVIPDALAPAPGFAGLAGLLDIGLDREGFLQPANARHRMVRSQRKGIYFAGPGHDDVDSDDLDLEIQAILADLDSRTVPASSERRVTVNEKKCAKCLTCIRVCPHNAIVLNQKQRPEIMADACFECQACVSNCPAYAIESEGLTNDELADQARKGRTLVYACERSAVLAAADALPEDTDLVSIPCACRISSDMILKALIRGASRVIVSGCHEGNCRSGDGTSTARQGVEAVSAMPGIPPDKVVWQSVAANEPRIFAQRISKV